MSLRMSPDKNSSGGDRPEFCSPGDPTPKVTPRAPEVAPHALKATPRSVTFGAQGVTFGAQGVTFDAAAAAGRRSIAGSGGMRQPARGTAPPVADPRGV